MDDITSKTIFKPYGIEDTETTRKLYFEEDGIKVWLQGEFYYLMNRTLLEVDKRNKKVINTDDFFFRSESGNSMNLIYHAKQIKSFTGVKYYFDNLFEDEGCIVLKDSTKTLMKQIMDFHKYNAIDICLDKRDYITITELQK